MDGQNEQSAEHITPYQAYRLDLINQVHDLNTLTDALLSHQLTGEERLAAISQVAELTRKLGVAWVCNCCTNPRHVRADCPEHGLKG